MSNCKKGFSIIELILAGAVFTIFSWGVLEVLLSGLVSDRVNQETTIATEYAAAGMEAVRVIKAESFDALATTAGTGITKQDGFFIFDGESNVLDGKYTRTIVIISGKRDGDGNITEGDGDADVDTVRVTVTVAWQASPTRPNSVVLETYLTRYIP